MDGRRLAELHAGGQHAAALVPLGGDHIAWVSSPRAGWLPSAATIEVLSSLARVDSDVSGGDGATGNQHASTAAHDIRNQLSLALLRLERLEGVDETSLAPLRGALRSGRALCSSFLEGVASHRDVSLRPLLEEEIRAALEAAPGKHPRVSLRCGARVFAHAPEVGVRRFLQNALSNAISAAPSGACLLVEVMSAGRGVLELAVEDPGPGFSAAAVARCFRPGHSGRGSTGVGTESLMHAAHELGSDLVLKTAAGEGARVSVRLRAARCEKPTAVILDADARLAPRVIQRLEGLGWWTAQAEAPPAAAGALDRWAAELLVVRRGACHGSIAELLRTAADLGIPCARLDAGDEGTALPGAP